MYYATRLEELAAQAWSTVRNDISLAQRNWSRHAPQPKPVRVQLLRAIVVGPGVIGEAGETHSLAADVASQLVAGRQAEIIES